MKATKEDQNKRKLCQENSDLRDTKKDPTLHQNRCFQFLVKTQKGMTLTKYFRFYFALFYFFIGSYPLAKEKAEPESEEDSKRQNVLQSCEKKNLSLFRFPAPLKLITSCTMFISECFSTFLWGFVLDFDLSIA